MEKVLQRSFQYFDHALKNQYQIYESFNDTFQTRKTRHREKRPNGVSFKLFLGSLNMKILSSALVFFALIKVFEYSSL